MNRHELTDKAMGTDRTTDSRRRKATHGPSAQGSAADAQRHLLDTGDRSSVASAGTLRLV